MAGRSASGSCGFIAVCIYVMLACGSSSISSVNAKARPCKLVLYEHEDRVAPGKTAVTTASPSGNYTIEFGAINVIANILTDGVAIGNSTKLGRAVGQVTFEDDLSLSLAYSFVLNTTDYAGSLTVQGVLSASGDGEVVITGGTGDFRWARGYAEVLTLSDTDPADVVFLNTLHLQYEGVIST